MKMRFEAIHPFGNDWRFETEGGCVSGDIKGVVVNELGASFVLWDIPERIDFINNCCHVILMDKAQVDFEPEPHKILPSDISKTIYQREKVTA